jgi:hypothetical protein
MPSDQTKHPCYELALEYGFMYERSDYPDDTHQFSHKQTDLYLFLHGKREWYTFRPQLDPIRQITRFDPNSRVEGFGVKSFRTHLATLFPAELPPARTPYLTPEEILDVVGKEGPV